MGETQKEQRRIRCSGCQEHIWLRYRYTDKKPLTAVGIDCPRESCQKLNRVYMPESATGIEVGEEAAAETAAEAPGSEAVTEPVPPVETATVEAAPPDSPAPASAAASTEPPPRNRVYWRPPRF